MFDRAICSHMRGDDRLSLLSAEAAARLNKSICRETCNAKVPPRGSGVDRSYLDVLPALIADEQRRVKETARGLCDQKRRTRVCQQGGMGGSASDRSGPGCRAAKRSAGRRRYWRRRSRSSINPLWGRSGGTAFEMPGTRQSPHPLGAFLEGFLTASNANRRVRSGIRRVERDPPDLVLRHRLYRRRLDRPRHRRAKGSHR